jgi:hypothetical protein
MRNAFNRDRGVESGEIVDDGILAPLLLLLRNNTI